jgi:hypothetical protein
VGVAPATPATSVWEQGQDASQTVARTPSAPAAEPAPAETDGARNETQAQDEPAPKHDWL